MRSADQQQIRMVEVIKCNFRIGDLCVHVGFKNVENLAADMLLDTSFINPYIQQHASAERKIVALHYHPVA